MTQISLGTFTYHLSDVSLDFAKTAMSGLYSDPDRVAKSEQQSHLDYFKNAIDQMQKHITPDTEAQAAQMLETFKTQYLKRVNSYLSTKSNIYSWFISGPAKYPVRRMQKRMDVDQRKTTEFLEWREYRLKRLCSILRRASNPLTRLEQLQKNLEERTTKQKHMIAVNALIRKYKAKLTPELCAALEQHGYNEAGVKSLLTPDFCGRIGFADYELTNNNAQIRRLKGVVTTEQAKAQKAETVGATETEVNGVKLEKDYTDNRLRLHFPTRPDVATIEKLKRHGWKWSRQNTAWQRFLTNAAEYNALNVILK